MKRRSRVDSSSVVRFSILVVLLMVGSSAGDEQPSLSLPSSAAKPGEWRACSMSPEDSWVPASHDSLTAIIQREYDRRYSCLKREGAKLAARYMFDSKCTERRFNRETVNSCLKGRRIIFIGDSLATQQGDSLLGMLGWHPDWLERGHPETAKWRTEADGRRVPALYECYRQTRDPVSRCGRCYDVFEATVPKIYKQSEAAHTGMLFAHWMDGRVVGPTDPPRKLQRVQGGHSSRVMEHLGDPSTTAHGDGSRRYADGYAGFVSEDSDRAGDDEKQEHDGILGDGTDRDVRDKRWLGEAERERGQSDVRLGSTQETSVHVRMFPTPGSGEWIRRVLADFNETRPSDVYVINFGAHYHDTPEEEAAFHAEVGLLLDGMAELADNATLVWREMSPTHFPSEDGSYEKFLTVPSEERSNICCTGTPPTVDPRNEWVEKYISDNGLAEKIKVLRIYQMSRFRAAAHRECHLAAPQLGGSPGSEPLYRCTATGAAIDCRHWSEPGVVEEWNTLMLNHLCPVG